MFLSATPPHVASKKSCNRLSKVHVVGGNLDIAKAGSQLFDKR